MKIKNAILSLLLVACLCVAGYSGYQLYLIYNTSNTIKKETEKLIEHTVDEETNAFSIDWEALRKESEDIIGWIYIPSCNVSQPIVQGVDNDQYLYATITGEYNRLGSIFLDAEADPDFTDDNSIIYGHSSDTREIFTDLDKFQNKTFFEENPTFYILTPSQNYICTVVFFSEVTETTAVYTTGFGDYREQVLQDMANVATYVRDVEIGDRRLVTLSTCNLDYGYSSDQRLALTAMMEPTDEVIEVN